MFHPDRTVGVSIAKATVPPRRRSVVVSTSTVALRVVVNMVFARLAGVRGFALATSPAMTFAKILWRRLMAASLSVSYLFSGLTAGRSVVAQGIQGFASICSGVPVLTGAARLLQIRDFDEALSRVTARLK
jgi:hypothetical protein